MKLTSFFMFFALNAITQFNYLIEYNVSNILLSDDNIILDNTFSLGIKKNKTVGHFGFGREDWYLNYFNNKYFTNPSIYNAHCRTYKISASIEHQFYIIKSKLSLNVSGGIKIYFFNQMKDSLTGVQRTPNSLYITKPAVLVYAIQTNQDPFPGSNLADYNFITSVPFAILGNIALQYHFKKLALKLYVEPYFMRIKYRNAAVETETGASYGFYSNLGLGVNYPLNFKKKDQKVTGIE